MDENWEYNESFLYFSPNISWTIFNILLQLGFTYSTYLFQITFISSLSIVNCFKRSSKSLSFFNIYLSLKNRMIKVC